MGTLQGEKILMTGLTGQVARPIAKALAVDNEVWGAARYSSAAVREELEAAGITAAVVDLAAGDVSSLPDDFTYVLNFAVLRTGNWDGDIAANAEGLGLLMAQCKRAKAFFHCSSTAVYQPDGHRHFKESDPLGDSHSVLPGLETYSILRIASEAIARLGARMWSLPTTIARLNVPYGDSGGWPASHLEAMVAGQPVPVHDDPPTIYNPINYDDLVATIPGLLEAASVPATIVNWGGNDAVSIEEWCAYMGQLTGIEPTFVQTDRTLPSVSVDVTKLHELVGPLSVSWQDGFRRMVANLHPELLKPE